MPRKARIEENIFRVKIDELHLQDFVSLESATSSAEIWGRLCKMMKKSDNIENRRACYDLWKRKGPKIQGVAPGVVLVGIFTCGKICFIDVWFVLRRRRYWMRFVVRNSRKHAILIPAR